MADLIDRAKAIKAIEDMQDCYNGFSGTYDKAQIIGVLEDVPTAEPQWIPCSERLPKIKEHHVSDTVICYCSNGVYAFSQLQENIFGQCGFECERDDDYHEAVGEVVAWMPLPKPYKGD